LEAEENVQQIGRRIFGMQNGETKMKEKKSERGRQMRRNKKKK